MRITNNMITRNYTKSLHKNLGRLSELNQQIISGRRFNTMSEDTAAGVRAMQVRRSLERLEGYRDNVNATASLYGAAEKSMLQISELNQSISSKYINAITGNMGADEREVLANELDKLRDQILNCANGQFADRYLFGGTNTAKAPLVLDKATNTLTYNGADVSTIATAHPELLSDISYVDIGLGLNFEDTGHPQQVNPNSAFKNTFNALDFLGTGRENIVLILGDMIGELRNSSFNIETAAPLLDKFNAAAGELGVQITKLGADAQYLEFMVDRLDTEEINLITRQQQLEARAPEEAILDFKMQEYSYNAALQMGQRLLQPTLFSFIS